MQVKLILAKGEPKGKEVVLAGPLTTIGRDPDCDVVIASSKVSRKHCHVEIAGDAATVVDDGSGNGTFVNGAKIASQQLTPGDKVAIGPLGFVVEIDGDAGGQMPEPPAAATGDLEDFLAGLESGDDTPSGAGDDDALRLSDDHT
jgi:pSer/pThr/pTyr-binding forkhead associated (FHA) protein